MGLKITNKEEHPSGNSFQTYLHICCYNKPKYGNKINVEIRIYKSKARRDADIENNSIPKSMVGMIAISLDMTMVEFAIVGNTAAMVYSLLKTHLQDLGKTVVDKI